MRQAEIKDDFIKELYIQDHELEFLMEDGNKSYYSCEDNNSSKSIILRCLPREEEGFQCEGDLGELPVKRGVNTFCVRITREGTVVKEYTISIVVKASPADVTLKALLVDDQETVLAKDGECYYYKVGEDCTQAEVEAIPSDPKADVEGDLGVLDLEAGMNFFLIRVYSADRSNKASYQLAIEREEGEEGTGRVTEAGEKREKDKGIEEGTMTAQVSQMEPEEAEREEEEPRKPEDFLMEDRAAAACETGDEEDGEASGQGGAIEASGHGEGAGGGENAKAAYEGRVTELGQAEAMEASGHDENAEASPGGEDAPAERREEDSGVPEGAEAEESGISAGMPGHSMDAGTEESGGSTRSPGHGMDAEAEESSVSDGAPEYGGDAEAMEYSKNEDAADPSSESRLSDLKVEGGILKPEFSPDVFDYKVNFQGEISEEILVEAVPMDLNAAVEGDMGLQGVVTGFNAFSVLCTAPDGMTKSLYKYSVEKRKPQESKVVKKSGQELKEKKKDYKKKVWKARLLKLKTAVSSKSEKKASLKQSQKIGAILLILLCANYPVYIYSTKPAMEKRTTLGVEAAKASDRRGEVEDRLFKKDETAKNIADGEERLVEIGNKYPHFPSQEEILYYLDSLQRRVPILYTATFIGEPTTVQSADILNDIASKNIGTVMGDLDLLTPPGPPDAAPEAAQDGSDSGEGGEEAVQPGQFRKNVLAVTLQGDKKNVLKAYEDFIENQRLIVTDDMQFSKGGASHDGPSEEQAASEVWSLSFNAYYYQYASVKERSY